MWKYTSALGHAYVFTARCLIKHMSLALKISTFRMRNYLLDMTTGISATQCGITLHNETNCAVTTVGMSNVDFVSFIKCLSHVNGSFLLENSIRSLTCVRSVASSQRVRHTVWYGSYSFRCLYLLFPLRSSCSYLRLLPLLLVPFIFSYTGIFPSLTRFRRQFLRKIRPIQSGFLRFIVGISHFFPDSMSYFFILYTIGPTDFLHPSPAPRFFRRQYSLSYSNFLILSLTHY